MNYTTLSSWGPDKTQSTIKQLIIATCIIATLSAGIQSIFDQFGLFPGPQDFLSLSWWGVNSGYVWQPLSFLFIQEAPGGLSFFFFVTLLFNMYLLWVIGSTVLQMIGRGPFLRLYFLGGMAAGVIALLSMKITGQYETLAGMTSALLILFTVWSMAFPETEILLLFLFPVKVKWIVVSIIAALCLISLSHWDLSTFVLYLSSVLIGYCYAVMVHGWYSPFPHTLRVDMMLSKIAAQFRKNIPVFFKGKTKDVKPSETKIIDINSERSIKDDDAFIDAMLEKISRKGENSLSWSEKKRMQDISRNKMKDGE
ncbi:MAG TPA: rhomboid family intramembrane serine protease [Parachlamydiaceae bacterium]|nr:rhomboid family intramembrane serine protease [Parachlamydiaceae bacterium]